jgi:hypothetical protein
MRDKLIAVEFGWRGASEDSQDGTDLVALNGCIGETLRSIYEKKRKALLGSKYSLLEDELIPVRFPLTAPNSRSGFFPQESNPLDPLTLASESFGISIKEVFPVKRKPVSLYRRCKLSKLSENPASFKKVFESDSYYYTNSLNSFWKILPTIEELFSNTWYWKWEWCVPEKGGKALFMEARFYGIDAVVSPYPKSDFDGLAIEIILRPALPEKSRTARRRLCSNVFVCSNHSEYIDYLDGVQIPRTKISTPWSERVKSLGEGIVSIKEYLSNRKALQNPKKKTD